MQSTLLKHCNTNQLHYKTKTVPTQSEFVDINFQRSIKDMQLISQQTFKENKESESMMNVTYSDSIAPENQQSPSKSSSGYNSENSNSKMVPNGIMKTGNGEVDAHKTSNLPKNFPNGTAELSKLHLDRNANPSSTSSTPSSRKNGYVACEGCREVRLPQHLTNPIYIATDNITEISPEVLNEHIYETITEEVREEIRKAKPVIEKESNPPTTPNNVDTSSENTPNPKTKSYCSSTLPLPKRRERVSGKDINRKLGEVDHRQPVASMAMDPHSELTYVDRVILELIETERMYVRALEDILAGYLLALKNTSGLPVKSSDTMKMFGNIKDIYAFNRKFLSDLENCESDPVKVGRQFVDQDTSFSVYTEYCTNYPMSVSILTRWMKNSALAQFFKSQQEYLRHSLPLGAYLLKPVQRILKYHLILHEMVKNCDPELENFWVIEQALATMTYIARHINEMKRKHEDAVHIQELQSLLTNWPGDDLTTYGKIAVEGDLKLQGAKNDRLVFLFDKMLLITKRREDGFLICKTHIMCFDLILLETVKDHPLSFLISPFDSSCMDSNQHPDSIRLGKQHILTARNEAEKQMWVNNIKRLIVENHQSTLPLKTQETIMNMSRIKLESSRKDGRILPRKLFGKTLSVTAIDMNGKIRRRSESSSVKMTLPKIIKKKDIEIHDDPVSEASSEVSTPTFKPRFSLPWINKLNKQDAIDEPTITSPSAPQQENESNEKEKMNEKERSEEEGVNERDSEEKADKTTNKRNEKYKGSVIYKRYQRRKSQPVTEIERRLSGDASSLPHDSASTEKKDKKKGKDVAIEDFDSFEDFLSYNADTGRESVSWDVQIVEAVFDRFRKEDEENNQEDEEEEEKISSVENDEPRAESNPILAESDALDTETEGERTGIARSESNETLKSENVDEVTPTEDYVCINEVIQQTSPLSRQSVSESEKSDRSSVYSSIEPSSETRFDSFSKSLDDSQALDAVDLNDVTNHVIEPSDVSEESAVEVGENNEENESDSSLKAKSSSYNERRKYFERLKEIREMRYSDLGYHNHDAGVIIQSGKVRDMIAQHRDQVASLAKPQPQQIGSAKTPNLPDQEDSSPQGGDSAASARRFWSQSKITREPLNRSAEDYHQCEASRKRDMDLVNSNNRFAAITTGTLPLHLTSSSNSSSNSSIDDAGDASSNPSKYKVLLQPRLFLWKSYFENNENSSTPNKNLSTSSQTAKSGERPGLSRQRLRERNAQKKRQMLKEMSKTTAIDTSKEPGSEDVDNIWEDFETKARKFENLSRSSSSEKLRVRQPHKAAPLQVRNDLQTGNGTVAEKTAALREAALKNNNSVTTLTRTRHSRNRYSSSRSSTSEVEPSTVTTPTKRETFATTPVTSKQPSSPVSATSLRLSSIKNKDGLNLCLSSSSSLNSSHPPSPSSSCTNLTDSKTISSIRRSSSYRDRQPVSSSFTNSGSPTVTTLSRHNSERSNEFSSRFRRSTKDFDSIANLRRSSSYRGTASIENRSPSPNAISAALLRRNSSRMRRQPTSASTEEISSPTSPSPLSSRYQTKHAAVSRTSSSSSLVRVGSLRSSKSALSGGEKEVEKSGKSVLKLAQRFDELSVSSAAKRFEELSVSNEESKPISPRNRWYRGRKHYSDLALPIGGIASCTEVGHNEVKKKTQLRRHESFATTKPTSSRDTSPTRRLSDSCFARASITPTAASKPSWARDYGTQRLNHSSSETKFSIASHSRLQRSNTCVYKSPHLSASSSSTETKIRPTITAGGKSGPNFSQVNDKKDASGSATSPPSDLLSRFSKS